MNAWIPAFWQAADAWGASIWRATWQGAIVLAAAWAIARWCTFLSPRVVCWIWRLACIKVLVTLVGLQPIDLALLPAQAKPTAAIAANSGPLGASHWIESPDAGHGIALDAPAAEKSRPPLTILAGLLLPMWILGVFYFIARTARQRLAVKRLRSSSQLCTDDQLLRMLQEESRRLGVRRLPRLQFSSRIESPLLVGLRWPTIILPERAGEKFDEAELRLMIAHELAHLRRHDLAWNWLPTLAHWVFFFHPLVWVMIRRWSESQEAACDEMLIQRRGRSRPTTVDC